jgi:hypothetical protein
MKTYVNDIMHKKVFLYKEKQQADRVPSAKDADPAEENR